MNVVDQAPVHVAICVSPEIYLPIGLALTGHEAPDARDFGDVSATTRPRRPLSEIVHRERW